jgi:hypothetical protein
MTTAKRRKNKAHGASRRSHVNDGRSSKGAEESPLYAPAGIFTIFFWIA